MSFGGDDEQTAHDPRRKTNPAIHVYLSLLSRFRALCRCVLIESAEPSMVYQFAETRIDYPASSATSQPEASSDSLPQQLLTQLSVSSSAVRSAGCASADPSWQTMTRPVSWRDARLHPSQRSLADFEEHRITDQYLEWRHAYQLCSVAGLCFPTR